MTREESIRTYFGEDAGRILEIGPSYNPIFPKAGGYNVESVDHANQEELMAKYRNEKNVDWRKIEPVDYVVSNGRLLDAIPHRERFDAIAASNVAEHTPDLIGFLNDCEQLLKPSGQLVMINPDKRYCFDFFRQISSTREVLQAHLDRRTRHSPAALFEHVLYFANRSGAAGWARTDKGKLALLNDPKQAWDQLRAGQEGNHYIDCHAWVFTPTSFRLIMKDLNDVGLVRLRERSFEASVGWFEFMISVSKTGRGCPEDRLTLCRRILAEQAAAIE